ncbi:MAG: hypothetical protein ACK5QX_01770, partial [bacterium]
MRASRLCVFFALLMTVGAAEAAVQVETVSLGRGVKAWYAGADTVPSVQINLAFEGAGYASDTADRAGLAQAFSNLVLEGTSTQDSRAFK